MGCNCGKKRVQGVTANVAQAMLEQAAAQDEQEVMIASAARAVQNANSNASARR